MATIAENSIRGESAQIRDQMISLHRQVEVEVHPLRETVLDAYENLVTKRQQQLMPWV